VVDAKGSKVHLDLEGNVCSVKIGLSYDHQSLYYTTKVYGNSTA